MPKVSEAYLEERRQQILDAAMACFARNGFHKTTMEDIGKEAGVSPGVAYRYFASKENIIETTVMSSLERWSPYFDEMEADDFMAGLDAFTHAWFARLEQPGIEVYYRVRERVFIELSQDTAFSEKFRQMQKTAHDRFEAIIRRGQERGQLNRDLDARAMGRIILALFNGLISEWIIDPTIDRWKYRDAMMTMLRDTFGHGA